jgi:hypothetical protein
MDQGHRSSSAPPSNVSYTLQDNELPLELDLRTSEDRNFEGDGPKSQNIAS